MFTEKEMSDALKWLFDLYQPEDYEAYDEEEVGSEVLCLPEICMALRDKVGTPYEYTIRTNLDRGFEYLSVVSAFVVDRRSLAEESGILGWKQWHDQM